MKKRIFAAILIAALACGVSACDGGNKPADTTTPPAAAAAPEVTASPSEITAAVLAEVPINSAFEKKFDSLPDYFDGLDTAALIDESYYMCASGAYPDEIAVFRFGTSEDAAAAVTAVNDRLEYQKKTYKDYTPEEYYKLEGAVVEQSGEWVYYIVTSDNEKAKGIIKGYLG
mgnify:CR=1 FL=1